MERGSGSREAAFLLHQATERYYHAAILVSQDTNREPMTSSYWESRRAARADGDLLRSQSPTTSTCLIF